MIGKGIYKAQGWKFEETPEYWQEKQVLIAFPHTRVMDTVRAFTGFAIIKQKGHIMVKKEAFKGAFGPLLKGIGGVPVDRKSANGVVSDMVDEFSKRDTFQLSMVPEGTRGKAKRIKTGFWHIAKQAGVPITCWYLDNENKRTIWVGQVQPTDSMEDDLKVIKKMYARVGYEMPTEFR